MLESFTAEVFAPHLDSVFAVEVPGETPTAVELALVAVTPATPPPGDRGRPPFALEFRGPGAPLLPQATYAFAHPGLGAFDLFIVPIGRDADGARYEAVFT